MTLYDTHDTSSTTAQRVSFKKTLDITPGTASFIAFRATPHCTKLANREGELSTSQELRFSSQSHTSLKWPIRCFLELTNQMLPWNDQSGASLNWPIRVFLEMTNEGRSCNDLRLNQCYWPEVLENIPIKVDISQIALKGTALYTASCDGSRWLTAGVIRLLAYLSRSYVYKLDNLHIKWVICILNRWRGSLTYISVGRVAL